MVSNIKTYELFKFHGMDVFFKINEGIRKLVDSNLFGATINVLDGYYVEGI